MMSDKSTVKGFDTALFGSGNFVFDDQYEGTLLMFIFDKSFIIPPTDGVINNIDVSSGLSGGKGPFMYSLSNNPSTLSIDNNGVISGTLKEGEYGVMTVKVKDENGAERIMRVAYGLTVTSDGGNGGGSNIILYVAIIAVIAIAAFAAYLFVLRPRMGQK
jgi:hypothetical protein